jgi:hypothetical protein
LDKHGSGENGVKLCFTIFFFFFFWLLFFGNWFLIFFSYSDDLKHHFAKHERVEDSWFVLSLEKQNEAELAEIALFMAGNADIDQVEEPEKLLVTLVDMGTSFEAKLLDTSFDVIDNYSQIEVEGQMEKEPREEVKIERREEDKVEVKAALTESQMEHISVRVCKEGDAMRFDNANMNLATTSVEILQLRSEVSRLSEQLNRMTDLQCQIDMLKSVFATARVGDSVASSPAHRVVLFDVASDGDSSSLAPPPPPPPPMPQEGTIAPLKARKTNTAATAAAVELKDEQIDQVTMKSIDGFRITFVFFPFEGGSNRDWIERENSSGHQSCNRQLS